MELYIIKIVLFFRYLKYSLGCGNQNIIRYSVGYRNILYYEIVSSSKIFGIVKKNKYCYILL